MAMAYVDLPQVEMRPLAKHSSPARSATLPSPNHHMSSSSTVPARPSMFSATGGRSGSSTASSPLKFDRRLEEVNLQLDDEFQEEDFLMRRNNSGMVQEYVKSEYVATPRGCVFVEIIGDTKKTPIVTYHDIGMNHKSSFTNFFYCSDMMPLAEHFCVYHINAPGQEDGAPRLPPDFAFPTMDELSEQVECVVNYFRLRRVIGLATGAGANVLTRFALNYPEHVQALILANPTAAAAGWVEWGYQKVNSRYLKKDGIGNFSFDYLLWHYFGRKSVERQLDLKEEVRENLGNMEPFNLALFIDSYTKRDKLQLNGRPGFLSFRSDQRTLTCSTMLLVGDDSPHLDDVVAMNNCLNPAKTSLVKVSDCGGLVLEEQPEKSAEAIRLFLQGMGYIPLLKSTRLAPTGIAMARCQSAYNLLARDWSARPKTTSLSSLH